MVRCLEDFLGSGGFKKSADETAYTQLVRTIPRSNFPTLVPRHKTTGDNELEISMTKIPPGSRTHAVRLYLQLEFQQQYRTIPAATAHCQTRKCDFFPRRLQRQRGVNLTFHSQIVRTQSLPKRRALNSGVSRSSLLVFCADFFFRFSFAHGRYRPHSARPNCVAAFASRNGKFEKRQTIRMGAC